MSLGDGTTGAVKRAVLAAAPGDAARLHFIGGQTRSLPRPRRRAGGLPDPGQGRVAQARPDQPSGSDRRRPGGLPRRDTQDGRDQRGLRSGLARRGAPNEARRAGGGATSMAQRPRRGGPPRPKPTRPVTGRLDLSGTFRPRNETIWRRRSARTGRPQRPARRPFRSTADSLREPSPEPPRAATPTGPLERDRIRDFRRPKPPPLDDAASHDRVRQVPRAHAGRDRGFEPSYIDWLAGTITRDPELVAAARVIQADLDARGIPRREHTRPGPPGPLRLIRGPDVAIAPRDPGGDRCGANDLER